MSGKKRGKYRRQPTPPAPPRAAVTTPARGSLVLVPPATVDRWTKAVMAWRDNINASAHPKYSAERVLQDALHYSLRHAEILGCTETSLVEALTRVARWGLDLGELCHLGVRLDPDSGALELQAWADYRGLIVLLRRQGIVRGFHPYVAYEGDTVKEIGGTKRDLIHEPGAKRGAALMGAYAIFDRPGTLGQRDYHWMPIAEIEQRRQLSTTWHPSKHPECPAWWAMACVIRDFCSKEPKVGGTALEDAAESIDGGTGLVLDGSPEAAKAARRASAVQSMSAPSEVMQGIGRRLACERLQKVLDATVWTAEEVAQIRAEADDITPLGALNNFILRREIEVFRREEVRRHEARDGHHPQQRTA